MLAEDGPVCRRPVGNGGLFARSVTAPSIRRRNLQNPAVPGFCLVLPDVLLYPCPTWSLETQGYFMPRFDELFKNDVARGVAIGIGVAAAAAFVVPAIRPVARAVVKTGILCFEKSRELVAEAGEALEDIVAEVKAELASAPSVSEVAENVMEAAADIVEPKA
jgi:Protein of unknown function (DUF5132)